MVVFSYVPTSVEQGVGFGKAFEWDVPLLDGYPWIKLDAFRLHSMPGFAARPVVGIAKTLRNFKPDAALVLGWHEISMLQVIAALKIHGVPTVVRGESNDLKARNPAVRGLHRLLMRNFDSALAIGQANRRFFEKSGIDANRIIDAPYFVDNDRFVQRAAELNPHRNELRRQWSIPGDAFVALFSGKIQHKKRPIDFLEAVRRVQSKGLPVHALVVGDGDLRSEAEHYARANGIRVSFAGFLNQSRISEAYVASDVLVLPSDHGETWGLVVNEAMASGLPAVVSDRVGCAHDLVLNGKTGFVFSFGHIDALSSVLGQLINSVELQRDMGACAARHVTTRYSIDRAVVGILEAVEIAVRFRESGSC